MKELGGKIESKFSPISIPKLYPKEDSKIKLPKGTFWPIFLIDTNVLGGNIW